MRALISGFLCAWIKLGNPEYLRRRVTASFLLAAATIILKVINICALHRLWQRFLLRIFRLYFRIFTTYLEKVILSDLMHGATFLLQHNLILLLVCKLRTGMVLRVRFLAASIVVQSFLGFFVPFNHALTLCDYSSIWWYVDVSLIHLGIVFLLRSLSDDIVQF